MANFDFKSFDNFFSAVLKLKDIEECRNFFEDVCTIKELQDMSQRLEVAKLLNKGCNYQDISKITGASTATISRVNKCLNYGGGGYKEILSKITDGENDDN
ncbi:MAG: hypothetical protein J6V68_03950 [Clostridia bacterium]|nr:hypothetical protein [Clostridia bacterium]